MILLLDEIRDNEVQLTSNIEYVEVLAEQYSFYTDCDSQPVRFDIQIPMTVHQMASGYDNGAFRVYLDGVGFHENGKQWDGFLITNGGAWCSEPGLPVNGRVSCSFNYVIPCAGKHYLNVQYAGTKTHTIGTLRSRRSIQVVKL